MSETTLDEKKFTLTWKVAIPVMFSLLIISNTFTLQISQIDQNSADNVKIEEAGRRRLDHALEKYELKQTIKDLNQDIVVLKKELKYCENKYYGR